ncbi:hypothetical protein F5J12DRAFT_800318 [Pisolithus orientalis]|uniref:uncharacterized protein n=1 Tax=Pisolithus orientalis TaxID=936130 RepID=UPI0022258580|nr:uncharacterized protein F5J12DRAFT_800318 [Pisolithus orientalis]KAI6030429.1 hypothetical protein F5J12DRAFT_800318 [Pisolithus orientalis]
MACVVDLPLELLEHILYMLDPLDVSRIAQSNRFFRKIRFWRGLYLALPLDDPRDSVTYLGNPRLRTGTSAMGSAMAIEETQIDTSNVNPSSSVEPSDIDWQGELQRIIRARTVVRNPQLSRKGEWKEVLTTLLELATTLPPVPFAESECASRNVAWVQRLLQDGAFLDIESTMDDQDDQAGHRFEKAGEGSGMTPHRAGRDNRMPAYQRPDLTAEESQMLARLHTWVGLTQRDVTRPRARVASRAFVYDLRNFGSKNLFGPFMLDGTMRVDWKCMWALAHVYGMKWIEMEKEETGDYSDRDVDMDMNNEWYSCPLSLPFCQSVIPPGMNLDTELDWAGVEGLWYVGYSFLDHREFLSKDFILFYCLPCVVSPRLLSSLTGRDDILTKGSCLCLTVYNYSSLSDALDTSIFEGDDVPEMHASVTMYFRVISTEHDPDHPTRPKINYAGELDGQFSVVGYVKLTSDDQTWWHFAGGNGDQPVWNCEGVGLGGVRSQAGVLGTWSTVFHDAEDPVGPLWMRRQKFIVD